MMTNKVIQLNYQLGQLPGVSYRAGLAGLIFVIDFLHRNQLETQEQVVVSYNSGSAVLEFNQGGLQALIDLTFDSRYELKWSKNKIDNPVDIQVTNEGKMYGWNDLCVEAKPLQERDSSGIWTSLWSEWLLKTVRAFPKSREWFKVRVDNQSINVNKLWTDLQKTEGTVGLSSSSLMGAEAQTAEGAKLNTTNAQEFLLNFWPYVSQPYIPCRFDADGKREDWGYTVAIPDVQDLEGFVRQFPDILERRPQNPPAYKGYRPLAALIELPEEAALDSIRLIRQYMQETQIASSLEFDVLGFEVCHAVRPDPKRGADVISITYIQPDSWRDGHYANYRKRFRCPWFRRHLMQNLVKGYPWTARWGDLLSTASQKWFEHSFFSHDCKIVFNSEENIVETSELIQLLKSLCDRYLNARLVGKGQDITWENKHKLARQEFLAVRARPQKDAFRRYFYETLCSQVTPVLSRKGMSNEEYEALSKEEKQQQVQQQDAEKIRQMILLSEALDKDVETVRGLTMLALASNFQFAERSNSSAET